MALGNNLRKKKLIPDEAEAKSESKKPAAKKPVAKKKPAAKKTKPAATTKKKSVSAKSNATKKVKATAKRQSEAPEKSKKVTQQAPTKRAEKKKVVEERIVIEKKVNPVVEENLPDSITSSKLPVYIAKELLEKKRNLRKRYQDEVASLKDKTSIQFVIISIGSEHYAIEIDNIKEIVPITDISKTPNTPSHIKGIANVRGRTYVVFDLADKFNVKGDEFAKYLLVLNNREINSSLTLSVLPSTLKVKGSNISSDLQIIEDALLDASYIKGLIQNGEQLIYYLDIIELIKNEKAIVVPDELLEQIDE